MALNNGTMRYSTEKDDLNYPIRHKEGNGFSCNRCGHSTVVQACKWCYLHIKQWRYDKSAMANTLFQSLKSLVQEAMDMVYINSNIRNKMGFCELALQFVDLQATAWFFGRRVQEDTTQKRKPILIDGTVDADEKQLGNLDSGTAGGNKGKKTLVRVAVEVDYYDEKLTKSIMEKASARRFRPALGQANKELIARTLTPDMVLTTNGLAACSKARIGQWYDDKKVAFSQWGCLFNLIKRLTATNHHATGDCFPGYTNELNFRFNPRNESKWAIIGAIKTVLKIPQNQYLCFVTHNDFSHL